MALNGFCNPLVTAILQQALAHGLLCVQSQIKGVLCKHEQHEEDSMQHTQRVRQTATAF